MRQLAAFRPFILAALASSFLLATSTSCRKAQVTADDVASAEDTGQGEEENAFTADLAEAAAPQDATDSASPAVSAPDVQRLLGTCGTRTYNAATRTLTIDFGATNCLCLDGRLRRGQIIAVFSGPYRQAGAIVTINRTNYFVNDNQHLGTRVITNNGGGSFSLDVQNASIIFANNGGTTSWSSQRQYTRTAGFGTATILDDAYSVTGSLAGTNRRSVTYEATIVQPLIRKFTLGCARHFVAGTINITNNKSQTMLLDYDPTGTQACDNIASVTINGNTHTITLR